MTNMTDYGERLLFRVTVAQDSVTFKPKVPIGHTFLRKLNTGSFKFFLTSKIMITAYMLFVLFLIIFFTFLVV